jgi:hypothetical protein
MGAVPGQEHGRQAVEGGPVHVAGDDRDDRGVAGGSLAGGGIGGRAGQPARPGAFGRSRARHAPQLGQRHVDVELGWLAGPAGHHAGGDQAPARLFQRVMAALAGGAGVLGAGLLAEGFQHRGQGGGAPWGQVPLRPARPAERDTQAQVPAVETAAGPGAGAAGAPVHVLGKLGQVAKAGAGRRGLGQDAVRLVPAGLRQAVGPGTQVLGPRTGDLASGQRIADHRVGG